MKEKEAFHSHSGKVLGWKQGRREKTETDKKKEGARARERSTNRERERKRLVKRMRPKRM